MATCKNCGRNAEGVPEADFCSKCPPRLCVDCGEMDSMADNCSCWVSIADMAPADVKAIFAADSTFNVSTDGILSVAAPLEP